MKKFLSFLLLILSLQVASSQVAYNFIGNGYWTVSSNWSGNAVPPTILPAGDTININSAPGDSCVLNTSQTVLPGAVFIVAIGAKFVVKGSISIYPQVTLCGIDWSVRNLDVSTYSNGDPIPEVTDPSVWATLRSGAWCWYNNDSITYSSVYGKLYNWYAVTDSRNIAPRGWHLPSYEEWISLVSCTGLDTSAGITLKDTVLWSLPNTGAINSSGFGARPAGVRGISGGGVFSDVSTNGYWWAPKYSDTSQTVARYRKMNYNNRNVDYGFANTTAGLSVRYIKNRLANITTSSVTSISGDSAICGGNITNNGGIAITERGICWSLTTNPTIQDYKTSAGTGAGSFGCILKPLLPKSIYYVRAYAINDEGIVYGQERTFTSDSIFLKTAVVTSVAGDSAGSGGNILSNAGLTITERGICWSNNPNPTIQNNRNIQGTGTGAFTGILRGLQPNSTYYVRAYAISSMGVSYAQQRVFTSAFSAFEDSIFIDTRDGQQYPYRKIGAQTWMTKNLNYVSTNSWCYDDRSGNCDVYGRLYTWPASFIAIPDGWHLPSSIEWTRLANAIGEQAGGKMKTIDFWEFPNKQATNSSGFNGLPGGLKDIDATYNFKGSYGMWWHSTQRDNSSAFYSQLLYNSGTFANSNNNLKAVGYSVRCVKNEFPIVMTDSIKNITQNTAVSGGKIINSINAAITARGVCWSDTHNPTVADNKTIDVLSDSSYSSRLSALLPNTTYYVRAYATNNLGTGYGDEMSFTTYGQLPVIKTVYFELDTSASVICGGIIADQGASAIITKGVCWSLAPSPTIANDTVVIEGSTTTEFNKLIQFSEGTTYYLRAFAINSFGISYGEEEVFTTINGPSVSIEIQSVTFNSATFYYSQQYYNGNAVVTAKGVCFSTSPNPITDDNLAINGSGVVYLNNLSANTLYYARTYTITNYGTTYGANYSFVTSKAIPKINTADSYSSVTFTSLTTGGTVIANNSPAVTARGVCWSIFPNPDLNDSVTINGSGNGSFLSPLTGLQPGTSYHVRAYAINSAGVAYGNDKSVSTLSHNPTLHITSLPAAGQSTLVISAKVDTQGDSPVTQRGICWSNNTHPTILDNKSNDGTGLGSFTSNVTGLIPNTFYYVRAYATNSVGTGYSSQFTFITSAATPQITTVAVTVNSNNSAISGGNITNDWGIAVTTKGVCWSTTPNPDTSNNKTNDGPGSGSFTSNITGLNPNTVYYIRAYAINSAGIQYGNELSFQTPL